MIDTSVLVAGIAGFRSERSAARPSAQLIRHWLERNTFTWLVSDEILDEYKAVLARLSVRKALIGRIINLLKEEAEQIHASGSLTISPDPGDDVFCVCAEYGEADFLVTLNRRDFPQALLSAHVIAPGDPLPTTARKKRPRQAR